MESVIPIPYETDTGPLALAFVAVLLFSGASFIYGDLTRKTSSPWVNLTKAVIGSICFGLSILWVKGALWPTGMPLAVFVLSGVAGLALADYFLMRSLADLGPGRVFTLFRAQPVLLGVASAVLFGQALTWKHWASIVLTMSAVGILMHERYRNEGKWTMGGIGTALLGISLDSVGILLSRWAFDQSPETTTYHVSFIRCFAAAAALGCVALVRPIQYRRFWEKLSRPDRAFALVTPVFGTFLSLLAWFAAIRKGHLASISAIAAIGPIFTLLVESFFSRKLPTTHAVAALGVCLLGFALLL